MFGYIYLTTNLVNGKRYVGQHKSSEFNPDYKGSGIYLWNSIRKHGVENYTVEMLEECSSQEEMNEKEVYWISFYDAVKRKDFYNITAGGNNHNPYLGLSEEDRVKVGKKISKAISGTVYVNKDGITKKVRREHLQEALDNGYSLGLSEERLEKFRGKNNPMYGRKHTNEARAKMTKIGETNNWYGKKWFTDGINNIFVKEGDPRLTDKFKPGRTMKKSTKQGISSSMKGLTHITKDGVNKRVKEEEIETYLSQGWRRGYQRKK